MKYNISYDLDFKRNKEKGLYIALEGIDGSGKTTQARKLAEYFKSKNYLVIQTREPRKTGIIGDLIHKVLLGKVKFPSVALQYLFSTDRFLNHEEIILPGLKEGKIVISDRSFWSAVVYGILDRSIEDYNYKEANQILIAHSILSMYHQFIVPDITFYLKIPLEISLQRLGYKKEKKEIYEEKEKIKNVLNGYNWLFNRFKKEITVIDATLPLEQVTDKMIKIIEPLLQKKDLRRLRKKL
jgi:dTMP kinase